MQQRLALAQAVMRKPKVLLLDEPFGALDPGIRADIHVLMRRIWNEGELTVVMVTHDLCEAFASPHAGVSVERPRDRPEERERYGARLTKDIEIWPRKMAGSKAVWTRHGPSESRPNGCRTPAGTTPRGTDSIPGRPGLRGTEPCRPWETEDDDIDRRGHSTGRQALVDGDAAEHRLTLTDVEGGANVGMLFYNPENLLERYNAPDTLKCQHTFKLTQAIASIRTWAASSARSSRIQPAGTTPCAATRPKHRLRADGARGATSGPQRLATERPRQLPGRGGEVRLGRRDLAANVNWFSKVVVAMMARWPRCERARRARRSSCASRWTRWCCSTPARIR